MPKAITISSPGIPWTQKPESVDQRIPWLFQKLWEIPKEILKFSIILGRATVKMYIPAQYCDCSTITALNVLNINLQLGMLYQY